MNIIFFNQFPILLDKKVYKLKYFTCQELNIVYLSVQNFTGWVFTSINLKEQVAVENLQSWVIRLLNILRKPVSMNEIKSLNIKNIESKINSLIDLGLVLREENVLRYNSWLINSNIKYLDYSNEKVFKDDKAKMDLYYKSVLPPNPIKIYKTKYFPFIHPASFERKGKASQLFQTGSMVSIGKPITYKRLSRFLYFGFGIIRKAKFLETLPAVLKTYPSNGARHEFELYIDIQGFPWLIDGIYHYNALYHGVSLLKKHSSKGTKKNIKIFISVIFERVQWRYRNSWNLRDIYMDYGHLTQHLKQVSASYNIEIEELKDTEEQNKVNNFFPPFFEEVIGGFQLITKT